MKKFLLPHRFQIIGFVLTVGGLVISLLRFGIGIKPWFFNVNVFAIYSSYFDTMYFTVINNNISEEISGITLLTGLLLLALSREKKEQEHYAYLRLRAFLVAIYCTTALLLLTFLFVYGVAFFYALTLHAFLPLIIYSLTFRYYLVKDHLSDRL